MPWQPGHYYALSPDEIRASVPSSSGVYGLFNFHDQLYVGESDNLQHALLRHCSEAQSLEPRYRPTGFTFQLCAADLRQREAAELIERLRPVRQAETELNQAVTPNDDLAQSELPVDLDATRIDLEEFSMYEREAPPEARPRYYFFERVQGAAMIALFAVCMTVSFYVGMLVGKSSSPLAGRESEQLLAQAPVVPLPEETVVSGATEKNDAAKERAGDFSNRNSEHMPERVAMAVARTDVAETRRLLAPEDDGGKPAAPESGSNGARRSTVVPGAGELATSKRWSVQISSAPAQDVANALAERLRNAGYDSYVVPAQVKGQTFYRVRVGALEGQEQAESLRETLAYLEGFRDAFLTVH